MPAELEMMLLNPAVFIDRDGTLNEMVYDDNHGTFDSPRKPDQVILRPGAVSLLKSLRARGYKIIVVTNQPGIAKGTLSLAALESVNKRLLSLLKKEGASWDALLFCPHHPGGLPESEHTVNCECRKPKPGMLLEAAKRYAVDMAKSWMVGDGLTDVQAGNAAGCKTCLVTNLKLEQIARFLSLQNAVPSEIAADLVQASALLS